MPRAAKTRGRLDLPALLLAPVGILALLLAQMLAGVPVRALFQLEAALIVLGGTLGAVLVSYSPRDVMKSARAAAGSFLSVRDDVETLSASLIGLAGRAHRRGLVALEPELDALADPFLREGLRFAIDESSPVALRDLLTLEATVRHDEEDAPARLFEAAAGYAPTLGILGAVLGLIDVMRNLAEPGALGSGIAVAFVATVYGVGAANLVLLPIAGRIRERALHAARRRELIMQGICAIHGRIHPRLVAHKLRVFGASAASLEDRGARFAAAERARRLPA